ncbi:oxidative damage protection protein [Legionella sp. W05-934-2]|jgi:Fe-S cluster biosynthesis and repair protein YggX|uniref:oxidative damage protection protein n=1 Tax=Legionella sp. W05-934-2 TaxID=1198649 RepID=UPI0034633603
MTNTVFCTKLKQELPALEKPPFPNDFGVKIQQTISAKAWKMWLAHQTMLINEYRLSLIDPKARAFLTEEMEKFLFTDTAEKPAGFTPINHQDET